MAKKGLLGKLLAAVAAVAAIGSACYIFRDKIRESTLYTKLDVDKRLARLKAFFKKEDDFFEEDEYLFHDTDNSSDRTYVSLDTGSQEAFSEASDAEEAAAENISGSVDEASDSSSDETFDNTSDETSDSSSDEMFDNGSDETSDSASDEMFGNGSDETSDSASDEMFDNGSDEASESGFDEVSDTAGESAETPSAMETIEDSFAKDALTEEKFDTAPVQENSVPTIAIETIGDIYDAATRKAAAIPFPSDERDNSPSGYDMEGLSDVSEDPEVLIEQDMLDEASFGY